MSERWLGWRGGSGQQGKESKYRARKTIYNGETYDSKAEARYAEFLDWRAHKGEIRNLQRQVRITLCAATDTGGPPRRVEIRYATGRRVFHYIDFSFEERVTYEDAGIVPSDITLNWQQRYVEMKGMDLPVGKIKRAVVESMLGIKIEVVSRSPSIPGGYRK